MEGVVHKNDEVDLNRALDEIIERKDCILFLE